MHEFDMKDTAVTFPVALVVSRFNERITSELLKGALEQLKEKGFTEEQITVTHVPGAVEIPLIAKKLAQSSKYEAIITLGAVIRGETSHYDYVCRYVTDGVRDVNLQSELPVVFGVLTTENSAQAEDRIGGAHGHKGKDAVDAAIEMVALLKELSIK